VPDVVPELRTSRNHLSPSSVARDIITSPPSPSTGLSARPSPPSSLLWKRTDLMQACVSTAADGMVSRERSSPFMEGLVAPAGVSRAPSQYTADEFPSSQGSLGQSPPQAQSLLRGSCVRHSSNEGNSRMQSMIGRDSTASQQLRTPAQVSDLLRPDSRGNVSLARDFQWVFDLTGVCS
jgi:hypothetical protein